MDRLMHNLATMSDERRSLMSWTFIGLGLVGLAVGIFFAHAGFAPEPSPENGFYLEWVPRHWAVFTAAQLVALGGSQLLLAGAALLWIANQPFTWARAAGAVWLAFMELIIVWAIVPSEWLNLTQGPLGWTNQEILFTIPPWLVLNNPIDISLAFVKDAILGGYHLASLGAVLFAAIKFQQWGKVEPTERDVSDVPSPYGRPLRKGDA
jgi:hypothetical protein